MSNSEIKRFTKTLYGIPKILLVDDDEGMLETLSDILEERGYRIETAKTGGEAVKKAEEGFFNVAIIDIKLPDLTGVEVLKTFRDKYPGRMNIIITAYATLQNAIDALNLGANGYIMKPIDPKILDQMINKCLVKQREALKITQEKIDAFDFVINVLREHEKRLDEEIERTSEKLRSIKLKEASNLIQRT